MNIEQQPSSGEPVKEDQGGMQRVKDLTAQASELARSLKTLDKTISIDLSVAPQIKDIDAPEKLATAIESLEQLIRVLTETRETVLQLLQLDKQNSQRLTQEEQKLLTAKNKKSKMLSKREADARRTPDAPLDEKAQLEFQSTVDQYTVTINKLDEIVEAIKMPIKQNREIVQRKIIDVNTAIKTNRDILKEAMASEKKKEVPPATPKPVPPPKRPSRSSSVIHVTEEPAEYRRRIRKVATSLEDQQFETYIRQYEQTYLEPFLQKEGLAGQVRVALEQDSFIGMTEKELREKGVERLFTHITEFLQKFQNIIPKSNMESAAMNTVIARQALRIRQFLQKGNRTIRRTQQYGLLPPEKRARYIGMLEQIRRTLLPVYADPVLQLPEFQIQRIMTDFRQMQPEGEGYLQTYVKLFLEFSALVAELQGMSAPLGLDDKIIKAGYLWLAAPEKDEALLNPVNPTTFPQAALKGMRYMMHAREATNPYLKAACAKYALQIRDRAIGVMPSSFIVG